MSVFLGDKLEELKAAKKKIVSVFLRFLHASFADWFKVFSPAYLLCLPLLILISTISENSYDFAYFLAYYLPSKPAVLWDEPSSCS